MVSRGNLKQLRLLKKYRNVILKQCQVRCEDGQRTQRSYASLPQLSPQEVTAVLQANEFTKEFSDAGAIKYYDSNQLASNNPIEDTRAEAQCLLTNGILLGIFDGHGGGACAQVISKRLFNYISACLLPQNELRQYLEEIHSNKIDLIETFNDKVEFVQEIKDLYRSSFLDFIKDIAHEEREHGTEIPKAITDAFLRLDADLSKEALFQNLTPKNAASTMSVAMSGAVAAVAHINGPDLHVAGVGDCQVVLGTKTEDNGWTPKVLTVEHTTNNRLEVDRILKEHPASEKWTVIKMERLLGQLAPLRALGDFRYKWPKDVLRETAALYFGEAAIPPNYHTPPYLSARPDVKHHRLTPKDKFLILASDGLWDLMSPLEAVHLVGEHMSGRATLTPLKLPPRKNVKLSDINEMLLQRKEGLKKQPLDINAATHLLRNALGGTEYGIDHGKLSQLLTLPSEVVRVFRDDITVTVVYFDSEFLRHCPT